MKAPLTFSSRTVLPMPSMSDLRPSKKRINMLCNTIPKSLTLAAHRAEERNTTRKNDESQELLRRKKMIKAKPANQMRVYGETSALKRRSLASAFCLLVIVLWPALAFAQTTSFTYQGRFTDSGTAASGTYDMQFKLFDSPSAG